MHNQEIKEESFKECSKTHTLLRAVRIDVRVFTSFLEDPSLDLLPLTLSIFSPSEVVVVAVLDSSEFGLSSTLFWASATFFTVTRLLLMATLLSKAGTTGFCISIEFIALWISHIRKVHCIELVICIIPNSSIIS